MISDLKTTLRHTSVYGVTNILKKGAAFFMIPVYTHFLSPSDYGILELLDLVLDFAFLLLGLQMAGAVVRYYHHYDQEREKAEVISTAFIFSAAMVIMAICVTQMLAPVISKTFFTSAESVEYLRWIFICLGCQLLSIVPEAFLMVKKKAVLYSSLSFISFLLALSLNIFFLVVMKMGIWGMIFSMVITKSVYMILTLSFVLPKLPFRFSLVKLGEMVRFGLPLIPGVLALYLINFADRFFIQQYCDSHELGIYSLGYKFGMLLVVLITDPFFRIWNTQRYEIAPQSDGPQVIGTYFTYYLGALIFLGLGLCIFSGNIISIMADQRYQASASVVSLISVSYIFQGIAGFLTLGIMVSYKTRYILLANLSAALVNLVLNLLLIPRLGIIGAATSTITTYAFLFLVVLTISQSFYRIRMEHQRITKLLVFSGIVFLTARGVSSLGMDSVLINAGIFMLFPAGLFLTGFFSASELDRIKAVISKRGH